MDEGNSSSRSSSRKIINKVSIEIAQNRMDGNVNKGHAIRKNKM